MELVLYTVKNRVATLKLNRPEKRNALNYELVAALKQSLKKAEEDDNVKVVVITGEGDAFCAGADLKSLQDLQTNTHEDNLKDSTHLAELYQKIYQLDKVVIAQINGHAIAGGCGLASVCDFSFSLPHAKFGYTEVRIGFVPAIVMAFLVRKIGEGKARDLLLSGKLINAQEAEKTGLINQVIEKDLSGYVQNFAEELCVNNSYESMRLTKKMLEHIQNLTLDESITYAAEMNAVSRSTDDCKKGIDAFLNKENIKW